jgi:hypothetical protein
VIVPADDARQRARDSGGRCWLRPALNDGCRHAALIDVSNYLSETAVPSFGLRAVMQRSPNTSEKVAVSRDASATDVHSLEQVQPRKHSVLVGSKRLGRGPPGWANDGPGEPISPVMPGPSLEPASALNPHPNRTAERRSVSVARQDFTNRGLRLRWI